METEVVIVGGGPGGSTAAMFLIKEGIKPVIVESERFPRYHIGESMTGAAGKVVRELGLEPEMERRGYPKKKGVKVYGTTGNTTWFVPVQDRDENWQLRDSYVWQVRRSDFDSLMLDEAVRRGATLLKGRAQSPLMGDNGSVKGVRVRTPDGDLVDVKSEVLVDASGQATFLANQRVTGPKYLGHYDRQTAFFSQVTGTVRDEGSSRETDPDNAVIFYQKKSHWAWFIPIEKDIVSVGVVTPGAYFKSSSQSTKDFLTSELQTLNPAIKRYIPEVRFVDGVHVIPNWSYQVRRFTGRGFICLGDAHRFVDPIFSFGLAITMREAQFAARAIRGHLEGEDRGSRRPFASYEAAMERGYDILEDLLDAFWEYPYGFAKYIHFDYKELMTDVFACRVYDHQPSELVVAIRKALKRERSYDSDAYSVPYGSRFHPERPAIWKANSAMESTEDWMGPK